MIHIDAVSTQSVSIDAMSTRSRDGIDFRLLEGCERKCLVKMP